MNEKKLLNEWTFGPIDLSKLTPEEEERKIQKTVDLLSIIYGENLREELRTAVVEGWEKYKRTKNDEL